MFCLTKTVSIARVEGRNRDSQEKPDHKSPRIGTPAPCNFSSQSTELTKRLFCSTFSAEGHARWPSPCSSSVGTALAGSSTAGGAGAELVPLPGCGKQVDEKCERGGFA